MKPIRNPVPGANHRAPKGLNNRAGVSHRPTRRREKIMGRFKSPRQAQGFLSAHDRIDTLFQPRRYRLSSMSCRHARSDAFRLWNDHTLETTAGPHQPRTPSPVTRQPGNTSEPAPMSESNRHIARGVTGLLTLN